jgi:adenylate cyclase
MSETRKLVAILVADVVGHSRLAGTDEKRTLARRGLNRSRGRGGERAASAGG